MTGQRPDMSNTGQNGAAAWAALVIVLFLLGTGILFFSGSLRLESGNRNADINVTQPETRMPGKEPSRS